MRTKHPVPPPTYLANLLWEAQAALTRYRRLAEQCGFPRLALSDLATFDELEAMASSLAGADLRGLDPLTWARDRMAALIEAKEQPTLGGDDRHFAEAVYGGHADDVRDALERLGLLPPDE